MCGFDSRWALLHRRVGKPGNSACSGSRRSLVQIQLRRLDCGGARVGTGRRLLSAPTQVRFLSPQLYGRASQLAMAAVSKTVERKPWGFDSLSFRLVCPWPSGKGASLPSWKGGFNSRRAFWGSANGRLPAFEPGDGGSTPPPRILRERKPRSAVTLNQ